MSTPVAGRKRLRTSSPETTYRLDGPLSPLSPSPDSTTPESPNKAKKLKRLADSLDKSPFPNHSLPTADDAADVHALLLTTHPEQRNRAASRAPPANQNAAQTCGNVKNVLESLIGTILSQNTNSKNSTTAQRGLDAAFGRNNFAAIASAPHQQVADALRHGGLADKKAKVIQRLLANVKEKHGDYSLEHLKALPDEAVMQELVGYDGVGSKTAGCVLLFCLSRPCFAVDTHVYRLSRVLGWVPSKASREQTQAHLEVRVPPELKLGLHVLIIHHGRRCDGCKNNGKGACPLKEYVKMRRHVKDEEVEGAVKQAEEDIKLDGLIEMKSEVPETVTQEALMGVKTELAVIKQEDDATTLRKSPRKARSRTTNHGRT